MLEDTPRQEATLDGALGALGLASFLFALANLMSGSHMLLGVVAFVPALASLYGAFSPAHHRGVLALAVGGAFALLALAFAMEGAATWRWVGALLLGAAHGALFVGLHAHLPRALHRHPARAHPEAAWRDPSKWHRSS